MSHPAVFRWSLCLGAAFFGGALVIMGCQQSNKPAPLATTEPFADHAGSASCTECHAEITHSFRQSPMGKSLRWVEGNEALEPGSFEARWPSNRFTQFTVQPAADNKQWSMTESWGANGNVLATQEEKLAIAVGSGTHGITYLIERPGGFLFEAPLSWYRQVSGWRMSPGFDGEQHKGFRRPVVEECLYCHSGGARPIDGTQNGYQPGHTFVEPAISCERCHGSGKEHVRIQRQASHTGDLRAEIVNPALLTPELAMDVCLQCHRSDGGGVAVVCRNKHLTDFRPGMSLAEVVTQFEYNNLDLDEVGVHFAGKMTQMRHSRCFLESGGKLHCLSCHSIHHRKDARQELASYRQKCMNCHSDGCPLPDSQRLAANAEDNCVACHMNVATPRDIPFSQITDHRIRVVNNKLQSRPAVSSLIELQPLSPGRAGEAEASRDLGIAYYELAGVHAEQARTYLFRASSHLRRAIQEDASDTQASLTLARVLAALGDPKQAVVHFRNAIDADPDNALAQAQWGMCLLETGEMAEAETHLKLAIEREPFLFEALLGLASLYARTGQHEQAAAINTRLAEIDCRTAPAKP